MYIKDNINRNWNMKVRVNIKSLDRKTVKINKKS